MERESIEQVGQRYRDEGYDVVVLPEGEILPPFAAGFRPDLIATRGNQGILVEVKANRIDLSSDLQITRLAEVVNTQPGWRLDVVVLEGETAIERASQESTEPSDEQLDQILKAAEDLVDRGYSPFACVVAWGASKQRCEGFAKRPNHTGGRRLPN